MNAMISMFFYHVNSLTLVGMGHSVYARSSEENFNFPCVLIYECHDDVSSLWTLVGKDHIYVAARIC
jgi:hypothetical protein